MARRTDLQLLTDMLKTQADEQASPARLAGLLGWEVEKVKRVAAKGDSTPSTPIFIAKGGVIKHRGSERGASVGIYADVSRVITSYWGERVAGLRNIDVISTARSGTRRDGVWTHPDLVIAADPRRRKSATEPRRLHAVEVETADGFDLKSVYQAHAQGRDADYSWVFGNTEPGVEKADWDRVLWTAQELGVGLVTFDKPHVYGTWKTHVMAVHKEPSRDEQSAFLDRVMSRSTRELHGL